MGYKLDADNEVALDVGVLMDMTREQRRLIVILAIAGATFGLYAVVGLLWWVVSHLRWV